MSMMRFKEIVVLDNFLRSADNTLHSYPANRRFLFETFGPPARRLGLRCSEVAARSDGGELDVAAMMDALGLPRTPAGWARSCGIDLAPLQAAGLLRRFEPGTLAIGWGMPPSLLHLIDRQGAAFIDLEIAPARFAAHLGYCARTNDRQIEAALAAWAIDDESYWNEASILRGYFSRRGVSRLFGHGLSVGLFCGQTAVDLALVRRNEIARPIDALEHVRKLASSVDLLVIKPHPYEADTTHLTQLAARLPNAAWTDANIYALLCADNVEFVCGLSSSALHEASYFMKEALPLIAPDRDNRRCLPAACSAWMSVGPGIASLQAMAWFCDGGPQTAFVLAPTTPAFPDDALDRAFDIRWGRDAHSTGLRELPRLAPGQDHEFHIGCPATAWLSAGWSAPDGAGAWADGERACIVIPLDEGALPDASPLAVQINGNVDRKADAGYRLSVRLAGTGKARALVLDFEFIGPRRFLLQQLSVQVAQRAPGSRRPDKAGLSKAASALAVAGALGVLVAAGAWLPRDSGALAVQAAELQGKAPDASRWSQIKRTVATHIESVRDDLEHLLEPLEKRSAQFRQL